MLVALCYSFSMATYPEYIKAALRRAHPYEEPAFDVYPLL